MKVLIVKTSSLGDVIDTLPALTDAAAMIPGIQFDWVVEESFAEIPRWDRRLIKLSPVACDVGETISLQPGGRKKFNYL